VRAAALPSETARLDALTLTAKPNVNYRNSWRSVELRAATPIDTPRMANATSVCGTLRDLVKRGQQGRLGCRFAVSRTSFVSD
jgi:hypothetical protein